MRTCSKCKIEKRLSSFYQDKSRLLGRSYICKDCDRMKGETWRKSNLEYKNQYWREWRKTPRGRQIAYSAVRKWIKLNPEHHKRLKSLHRQRKRAGGKLDIGTVNAVYERCRNMCIECGVKEHLTLDHIKPVSLGGTNELANLQILCRICNSRKSNKYKEISYA